MQWYTVVYIAQLLVIVIVSLFVLLFVYIVPCAFQLSYRYTVIRFPISTAFWGAALVKEWQLFWFDRETKTRYLSEEIRYSNFHFPVFQWEVNTRYSKTPKSKGNQIQKKISTKILWGSSKTLGYQNFLLQKAINIWQKSDILRNKKLLSQGK